MLFNINLKIKLCNEQNINLKTMFTSTDKINFTKTIIYLKK